MSSRFLSTHERLLVKSRSRTITYCCNSEEPADVAQSIDALLDIVTTTARLTPPFFSRAMLMERYSKSRKWVERLPIPRTKMGGAILYARDAVLRYEADCAEGEDTPL